MQTPPVKEEPVKPPVKDDDKYEGPDETGQDETGQDDSWWPNGDDWRDIFGGGDN
ncbi:hypothetical protein ACIBI9_08415 [Nonomuraea sp. NPDC050451]|uniref:hypothetical protein n=1 Tax=Nonomuraea sp. NPDC050451 TaxID=3364364 RepID=UPI0037BB99BE